jgi:Fur family transcriptional regulator, ferric uptake regulator
VVLMFVDICNLVAYDKIMTVDTIIKSLRENKKRITPGRRKIVELFCRNTSPLSVRFLVSKTKLNKTSVYRELALLDKLGIVQDVDFADRKKRYELKDLEHHHHLVCIKCKHVDDIKLTESLNFEEKRIEKLKKFRVLKHNLEFFGYCQSCGS